MPLPNPDNKLIFADTGLSKTSIKLSLISTLVFFLFQFIGILHHEPFCDEYQAFQISLNSHSLRELFFNMRQEGHPALWYLILFVITYFNQSLFAMQLTHIVIASAGIFILFRFAPFSLLEKILISLGYFFFYEYAQISREYVIGLFCIMAICAVIGEKYYKRKLLALPIQPSLFLITATLMFLLSNGSTYGLVLSVPLSGYFLWIIMDERKIILTNNRLKIAVVAAFLIVLSGWAIVYIQIKPPADNVIPVGFNSSGFVSVIPQLITAYLPFPKLNTLTCRDTYFIDNGNSFILISASIVVVILILFSLIKKPPVFFLYWVSLIAIAAFLFYVNNFWKAARYRGHFFIALVVCYWLEKYIPSNQNILPFLRDRILDKLKKILLYPILVVQVAAGIYFYYLDFNYPFSNIPNVGEYIVKQNLERFPAMGGQDILILPLSYYTGKPIYSIDRSDTCRFVIWDKKRKWNVDIREFFKELLYQVDNSKTDTILLALTRELPITKNGQVEPLTEENLDAYHHIRKIYMADDTTINSSAGYYLYLVWKKSNLSNGSR